MPKLTNRALLQRYSSSIIIDHLASNYVMGLLSPLVRNRVDTLKVQLEFRKLDERIDYWEQKLSPLNETTPELIPQADTWKSIESRLKLDTTQTESQQTNTNSDISIFNWFSSPFTKLVGAFALIICISFGANILQQNNNLGSLSYIAVLQNDTQNAQVVAATYGDSKKLVLDIVSLPKIESEQSFELWVTSKTDKQTRSLGEIPKGKNAFDRELTQAEWRLIADSSFLIISIEDAGGSAIGEPSDMIISKGECIRLNQSKNKA